MDVKPAYFALSRYYDLWMPVDYQKWASYLLALALHHHHLPGNILDLGCGTGNLTLLLAKRGYQITGVDASPQMVEIAQKKAEQQGTKTSFSIQEITKLSLRQQQFNTVISSCDVLNYLLTAGELKKAMQRVYRLLSPGGLWLFDLNSARKLERVYGNQSYADLGPNVAYFWDNSYEPQTRICSMELTFFVEGEVGCYQRIIERHRQKVWMPSQIRRVCEQNGFILLGCYRFLSFARCGEDDERWQFVLRKKE